MTIDLYHDICAFLRSLTEGTEWQGHVYTVGGCCRDALMNRDINDIDLAINLPDGGIRFAMWLYRHGHTTDEPVTFPAFGTAKLRLRRYPDEEIECVQTRREKYTDRTSRNPETAFGSVEEDAMRRDLTINALYRDIGTGCIMDITGHSIDDIRAHVIRTPSDPDETFDDDPVRILRCIRFAARFGWEIQPATWEALCRQAGRLEIVSAARIRSELEKTLTGPRADRALEMMRESGALRHVLPEMTRTLRFRDSSRHDGTMWRHALDTIMASPPDFRVRMAALLHDLGKLKTRPDQTAISPYKGHERAGADMTRGILRRLRFHKEFIRDVEFLVRHHMYLADSGADASGLKDSRLRYLQRMCGTRDRFDRLLCLIDAENNTCLPSHRCPAQAASVRSRSLQMEENGTDMFGIRDKEPRRNPERRRRRQHRRQRK